MNAATENLPKPHPGWMKPLARLGYAARGLVYLVIALFALLAAIGGGEAQDTTGALEALLRAPAGDVVAALLVVGLAGHSLWRFVQAIGDTDDHGTSAKGLAVRVGLLAAGFTYAVLTVYTVSLWRVASSEGGQGGAFAEFLSGVVGASLAAWLLAAVFLAVAIAHIVKAVRKGYRKYIQAPGRFDPVLDPVSRTGLIARGAVFAIIAVLFATRGLTGAAKAAAARRASPTRSTTSPACLSASCCWRWSLSGSSPSRSIPSPKPSGGASTWRMRLSADGHA